MKSELVREQVETPPITEVVVRFTLQEASDLHNLLEYVAREAIVWVAQDSPGVKLRDTINRTPALHPLIEALEPAWDQVH